MTINLSASDWKPSRLQGAGSTTRLTGGTGIADTINGGAGNDTINVASGAFVAGESIDGGADNDTIVLTGSGATANFSVGTISNVENLTGTAANDAVTLTFAQFGGLSSIDLGGGTSDDININVSGTVDTSGLGAPSLSNTENVNLIGSGNADTITLSASQYGKFTSIDLGNGTDALNVSVSGAVNISSGTAPALTSINTVNLVGSASDDSITLTGSQLNNFTAIDLGAGTSDTINLTSTSTGLNGLAGSALTNVEAISAAGAASCGYDNAQQSDGSFCANRQRLQRHHYEWRGCQFDRRGRRERHDHRRCGQ